MKERLHQVMMTLASRFQRFMQGRYGGDKLNMALIWVAFGFHLLQLFAPNSWIKLALIGVSYLLVLLATLRFLSRNIYKRYQENRKYLRFLERLKDREHKHFDCPRCHQPVRVPRKKGKIAITCPKCKEKFIRKT